MPRNMRKNVILPGKTGQQEAGALCIWVCMCVCVCVCVCVVQISFLANLKDRVTWITCGWKSNVEVYVTRVLGVGTGLI